MGSHPEGICADAQGTDRDDEHLNIFLEFVPGGSIASLLTKFGELLCVMLAHPLSGLIGVYGGAWRLDSHSKRRLKRHQP